jgi:hypothetical protein
MLKFTVVRRSVVLEGQGVRVVVKSSSSSSCDSEMFDPSRKLRIALYMYVTTTSRLHTINADAIYVQSDVMFSSFTKRAVAETAYLHVKG